jgi:Zn-dependent M28 family amino/carboxypeptidase
MKLMAILLFCLNVSFAKINNTSALRNQVRQIKQKDIMKILRDFINESRPSRMVGKPGHIKAHSFLMEKVKEVSHGKGLLKTEIFKPDIQQGKLLIERDFQNKIVGNFTPQTQTYQKWKRFTKYMGERLESLASTQGKNIIWSRKGSSTKTLIIGAHYDTISHDKKTLKIKENESMPGADYNASGVAVALGLIELFSKLELKHNVEVVFFDYQGFAYLGSADYVKRIKDKKDILLFVNLEMLGHDSLLFDKQKKQGNMKLYTSKIGSSTYVEENKLAKRLLKLGRKAGGKVKFEIQQNGFDSSDHYRFWEQKIPAICFSQNWEEDFNQKNYQTPNDFPETLNQKSLYGAYKFIATSVAALALGLEK